MLYHWFFYIFIFFLYVCWGYSENVFLSKWILLCIDGFRLFRLALSILTVVTGIELFLFGVGDAPTLNYGHGATNLRPSDSVNRLVILSSILAHPREHSPERVLDWRGCSLVYLRRY